VSDQPINHRFTHHYSHFTYTRKIIKNLYYYKYIRYDQGGWGEGGTTSGPLKNKYPSEYTYASLCIFIFNNKRVIEWIEKGIDTGWLIWQEDLMILHWLFYFFFSFFGTWMNDLLHCLRECSHGWIYRTDWINWLSIHSVEEAVKLSGLPLWLGYHDHE
jgi:hypothetical protein